MRRASADEKQALCDEFVRLCEIESPSRRERAVADYVAGELRGLGLQVSEDSTGAATGSAAGNLLARIPGPDGARTILLCAHLDTVPLEGPVEVVRENEAFSNRHDAILGADNKAAVAVFLALARRLVREGSPVGIELLFTTCEELALAGAKEFDLSQLRSEFGYVLDHASPIGELIVAAPTYYRIEGSFRGEAAHAGIKPEAGHNAIQAAAGAIARLDLGRLDAETTANVGTIRGGTAANVVAERCQVELEARSLDHQRVSEVVSRMVDVLTEAASDFECDVEIGVSELFRGYRIPRTAQPVEVAAAALDAVGIEPQYVPTGGGSDANAFQAQNFPCLNIANGTERNHRPDESVTVGAIETMLDVMLETVGRSA